MKKRQFWALLSHAVWMYANLVSNVVVLDSVEGLRNYIEDDPIIKESMTYLGVLVYCYLEKSLAALMVAAHTMNHMCRRKEYDKGVIEEEKTWGIEN